MLLQACSATLDLSNLDVKSFRFFRYINRLPNGDFTYARAPAPSIEDNLNRAKASEYISYTDSMQGCSQLFVVVISILVAVYFRNVVLGNNGYEGRSVPFVFHPTVEHLKENFQSKHGFRGEKLVEQLGNGEYLAAHYKWHRVPWHSPARHQMHLGHHR